MTTAGNSPFGDDFPDIAEAKRLRRQGDHGRAVIEAREQQRLKEAVEDALEELDDLADHVDEQHVDVDQTNCTVCTRQDALPILVNQLRNALHDAGWSV